MAPVPLDPPLPSVRMHHGLAFCRGVSRAEENQPVRRTFPLLTVALVMILPAAPAAADPPGLKTLPIGADAPDFNLPGVDGRNYRLQDFAAARILVVIFTC